ILRSVAKLGPVGTQKLRTKFGGKKMRGYKPAEFAKGSGSIIRKIMQQLESAGLIAQASKGVHKGRILSAKGTSFLDKIAIDIAKQAHKEKAQ
ncbi:MAG: 40S ribosomal protein S19, partial [Nanoarchaeota archaeon]